MASENLSVSEANETYGTGRIIIIIICLLQISVFLNNLCLIQVEHYHLHSNEPKQQLEQEKYLTENIKIGLHTGVILYMSEY